MEQTPGSVYYTASESGEPETPYPYQTPLTKWASREADTTPWPHNRAAAFQRHLDELPSDDSTPMSTPHAHNPSSTTQQSLAEPHSSDATITVHVSNFTTPTPTNPLLRPSSILRTAITPTTPTASPLIREVMLRDCAPGSPAYPDKLLIAVDRVAASLTARGRPKESAAVRALYEQSFKDPGSAGLLDAVLRRRTTERQRIDFRRYAEDVGRLGEGRAVDGDEEGSSGVKRKRGAEEMGTDAFEVCDERSTSETPSQITTVPRIPKISKLSDIDTQEAIDDEFTAAAGDEGTTDILAGIEEENPAETREETPTETHQGIPGETQSTLPTESQEEPAIAWIPFEEFNARAQDVSPAQDPQEAPTHPRAKRAKKPRPAKNTKASTGGTRPKPSKAKKVAKPGSKSRIQTFGSRVPYMELLQQERKREEEEKDEMKRRDGGKAVDTEPEDAKTRRRNTSRYDAFKGPVYSVTWAEVMVGMSREGR